MLHVEFAGINGAGKSTLYHRCNAYLANRLGYKPGPDKLWLRLVDDPALLPPRIQQSSVFRLAQALDRENRVLRRLPVRSAANYGRLARAALQKRGFLEDYLRLAAKPAAALGAPGYAHWDLQYLLSLLTWYQQRVESPRPGVLLLDEGFVSVMADVLETGPAGNETLVHGLLQKHFAIRYVFWVRADVELCLRRLAKRGIPAPYAHLTNDQLRAYLREREAKFGWLCERLAESGTNVVTVHNDRDECVPLDSLRPYLHAIAAIAAKQQHSIALGG